MRVVLLLILLAGCTDPASRAHDDGRYATCRDGVMLEPASDQHDDGFESSSKCPGGTVTIEAPAAAVVYEEIALAWEVVPAGGHHAQRTELRVSGPEERVLATEEDTMVPRLFRAAWTPLEPGAYTMHAWASLDGVEVLSRPADVDVAEVPATGITHDVAISAGGPASGLQPTDLRIRPGDGVRFTNQDAVSKEVLVDGPQPTSFTLAPGASREILLHRLGLHPFSAQGLASAAQGNITVEL